MWGCFWPISSLSPHRWKKTASTVCTAYSTRPPAPSTSIHAAFSCGQSCPRAAMLSSPPPSSQATLASSCSESSQMFPPTAGVWGLGLVTMYPMLGLEESAAWPVCVCSRQGRSQGWASIASLLCLPARVLLVLTRNSDSYVHLTIYRKTCFIYHLTPQMGSLTTPF